MKKLVFFILLSGIAFKLKAQQNSNTETLGKLAIPDFHFQVDTITPKLLIEQKKNHNLLFLPMQKQQNLLSNNLVASLDKMPIVKPVGKWNMPVMKPDGTIIYTTPIKRLPPVIHPETETQKSNP